MRTAPPLADRSVSPNPLFVDAIIRAVTDLYHPVTNPSGHISIGVAENTLCADFITKALHEISKEHPLALDDLNYSDFQGTPKFRAALAKFFQKYIFDTPHQVDPNHIIVYNGAGSIIESLASCMCNEEEFVMIPAPMYLAFENDLQKRFKCRVLPVCMPYNPETNEFELTQQVIIDTLHHARSENKIVRAFILCQPNNPTGDIYTKELMQWLIDWTSEEGLHFVSDEVYARSVFNADQGQKFISAGALINEPSEKHDYTHVHIVYSFSKDITLNGFRVGVLHTTNKHILDFLISNAYFQSVSTHTQHVLTHLLERTDILDSFFTLNCERLLRAYQNICQVLDEYGVHYVKARAGVFVWIDFTKQIQKKLNKTEITVEDELEFWNKCCIESRVYIPSGYFFKCSTAGWFRVCFTAQTMEVNKLAFERIFNWINA
jgi:1-aminocyclopropane-1-carboxylate synthase